MPAYDEIADRQPTRYADHSEMRRAVLMTQAELATVGHSRGRAQALIDLVDTMIHDAHIWADAIGQEVTPPPVPETHTQAEAPTVAGLYWAFCESEWEVVKLIECDDGEDSFCMHQLDYSGHLPLSGVERWGPRVPEFQPLNNEVTDAS